MVAFTSRNHDRLRPRFCGREGCNGRLGFFTYGIGNVFRCSSCRCACLLRFPRPHPGGYEQILFTTNNCRFEYQARSVPGSRKARFISPRQAITPISYHLRSPSGTKPQLNTFRGSRVSSSLPNVLFPLKLGLTTRAYGLSTVVPVQQKRTTDPSANHLQ